MAAWSHGGPLLVYRLLIVSLHAGRGGEFCGASFIRALTSIMRALSSEPNHLSKAAPTNTIMSGIRI